MEKNKNRKFTIFNVHGNLKCMNGMAPGYLADRFVKRFSISGRQTRSASSRLLDIPLLKTTAG